LLRQLDGDRGIAIAAAAAGRMMSFRIVDTPCVLRPIGKLIL
jgi:hypothetical protein